MIFLSGKMVNPYAYSSLWAGMNLVGFEKDNEIIFNNL
jgi:hypothetical protein